jgi:hypothetical protein
MKLTLRTIKGTTFNIEAEPTTTVGELKSSVESSQGEAFPKEQLKLVYKGKVLDDDAKAVSEYSVDETGFLVVFVQKAVTKPAAAAATGTAGASSSAPAAAAAPAAEVRAALFVVIGSHMDLFEHLLAVTMSMHRACRAGAAACGSTHVAGRWRLWQLHTACWSYSILLPLPSCQPTACSYQGMWMHVYILHLTSSF